MTFTTEVPFSGFCETIHSDRVDTAVEYLLEEEELSSAEVLVDFEGFKKEYAEQYVEAFCDYIEGEHGVRIDMEFTEVVSPKEYNFQTDKIYAEISEDSLTALMLEVSFKDFSREVYATLRPRDGFSTSRSYCLAEWLCRGVFRWDSVELGMLLEHFAKDELFGELEPGNAQEIAEGFVSIKEEVVRHVSLYVEVPEGVEDIKTFCAELDGRSLEAIMSDHSVETGDSKWEENV